MKHGLLFLISVILIGIMTFFAYYIGMRHEFTDIIRPLAAFSSALGLSFLLENTKYKIFKISARVIQVCLAGLFIILFFLFLYYFGIGKTLEHQDILAVMQTDGTEAIAYIKRHFLSFSSVIPAITIFIISLLTFTKSGIFFYKYKSKIKPILYILFSLSVFIFCIFSFTKISTVQVLARDITNYKVLLKEFKEIVHSGRTEDISFTHQSTGEVHVILIGESASRNFMRLYTQNPLLPETPYIENISSQKNAVLFPNAYAFVNATVGTLTAALSDGRTLTGTTFPKGENIMSTARAAGFKTIWLSNQASVGQYENPISAIAHHADETVFINTSNASNFAKTKLDEELVPIFSQILQTRDPEQNYIIFVHLMGSHSPYDSRIPGGVTDFDLRGRAKVGKLIDNNPRIGLLNLYLASLEYTDFVIGQLFEAASAQGREVSSFIYFSDHGEDIFTPDGEHRTVGGVTWSVMRVPFFIWLSDEYAARHPEKINALKENREKIFTNDLLYDLILGLSGIKTKGYSANFDISSADYAVTLENARTNLAAVRDEARHAISDVLSRTEGHFKLGALNVDSLFKAWFLHDLGIDFFALQAKVTNNALVLLDAKNKPLDMPAERFISQLPKGATVYLDISGVSTFDAQFISGVFTGLAQNEHNFIIGTDNPNLAKAINTAGLTASYLAQKPGTEEIPGRIINRHRLARLFDTGGSFTRLKESSDETADIDEYLIVDSTVTLEDKDLYEKLCNYFNGKVKYVLVSFKSQYDSY